MINTLVLLEGEQYILPLGARTPPSHLFKPEDAPVIEDVSAVSSGHAPRNRL